MIASAILSGPRLWLVPLAAALAGASAAWWVQSQRLDAAQAHHRAEIAAIHRRISAEREAAARAAADKLAAAQDAERRAVHALHATKAALTATQRRLKEALYALPTARHCGLSRAAVGLLDRAISPAHVPVPEGAAEPDRADAAAAAAAEGAASEAAVGAWIADVAALYGECRARLDAIRAWDAEVSRGR